MQRDHVTGKLIECIVLPAAVILGPVLRRQFILVNHDLFAILTCVQPRAPQSYYIHYNEQ